MPTREELESALVNAHNAGDTEAARTLANALKAEEGMGGGEAFGRAAFGQYLENMMNIPNAAMSGAKVLSDLPRTAVATAAGISQGLNPVDILSAGVQGSMDSAPSSPVPESEEVLAYTGMNSEQMREGDFSQVGQLPDLVEQQRQISAEAQDQHPAATTAGELAGSAATLLTGRTPLVNGLRDARVAHQARVNSISSPGVKKYVADIIDKFRFGDQMKAKTLPQLLTRGTGRGLETGLEGASLALIEGNDPIEVGAYSAGGQIAGSAMLSLMPSSLGPKGLSKFGLKMLGLTALFRAGQEYGPGENSIYAATDDAFNKATTALTLGALTALSGGGRLRSGPLANNVPFVAEAFTQIPRGMFVAYVGQVTREAEEGINTTQAVFEKLASDPEYFNPVIRNRLERAITNDNLEAEMPRLMNIDSFREKVESLN